MGLIDRILRVMRANLNSFMTSRDDPEKLLEAIVMEMQDNLVQLRQALAQAIAIQKRSERQLLQTQSTAQEWYRRAQLALQQENDILAREALTKRQAYQQTATTLSSQISQQKIVVDKLKNDMRALELKIAEVRTKKDMYIARARSAEASYKLQDMLNGVSNTNSLNAFERMEEKVVQLEAQSEAIAKLDPDELNSSFASLELGNTIDAELRAMKGQILADKNQTQQ
ncbi:PspA/IM30 family protein [Aetokthonos hydrillicola Thurmond2011]|uniref:PspA/IM30 family protein n=2 Tax=Aetokthonos TaxID=1550243 RepID=A0AAP5I3X6_9CYAN|nr:PspA/IM30 family protein [Aetokthonos hydrillicola]MBO3463521.1 PspA/IM30 family protein [Aetokthonos hydrillicola CCALA 1050]MBW4584942.1 PspA/IM30 family protein [Aetokthonos hydrillicola CCALA 1050]MDR9894299.1 PspA/IM30 family protein [Aetokthonos hydrillicola Thurmond2011]